MTFQPHARPHLEIHSRSKNHSAVAGAAYRLGLRLYDERAEVWHDFRKRAEGEEVVFATTLAPPGGINLGHPLSGSAVGLPCSGI